MPAATTIIAGAGLAYSVGKNIHESNQAKKDYRRAKAELDKLQTPDTRNVYTGMSVPTAGYEMQRQEAIRSQAEAANLLSMGGSQSAIGGASALSAGTRNVINDISSQLTNAEFNLKQMIAQDEARIQGINENRYQSDVAGLGAEMAFGKQRQMAAGQQLGGALFSAAELASSTGWGNKPLWGNNTNAENGMAVSPMTPRSPMQIENNYTLPKLTLRQ